MLKYFKLIGVITGLLYAGIFVAEEISYDEAPHYGYYYSHG